MDQHFTTQEVDRVEDKGSGNKTTDVKTFMDAFLNMTMRSSCFIDEAFLNGKKYSRLYADH